MLKFEVYRQHNWKSITSIFFIQHVCFEIALNIFFFERPLVDNFFMKHVSMFSCTIDKLIDKALDHKYLLSQIWRSMHFASNKRTFL